MNSVDKVNVSPVLKQTLVFQLGSTYTAALSSADLSCKIKGANNYSRDLYIMSVNDSAKTFTVKFNGAPVGSYTFEVRSKASGYGLLDTDAITF